MKQKFKWILTPLLVLSMGLLYAQEKTISGTVTDQNDLPLPGVNIVVQGTTTGTQTDFDGNYSIEAEEGQVLVFTYIGQAEVQHTVGAGNTIDVQMEEDAQALDEVIVTALGIERKPRELSYSVAKVDTEQLTQTRSTNAATAMVGKVSGMQINTIGNGVNPNTRVVLRGNRSLLGNNQALIVIDGYPSSRGALDRLNPDDIAEINVLKGSNAAALYGSEASNGVLVISTKTGTDKLQISLTNSFQHEQVAYLPELQDEFGVGGFPDGTLWPLENVAWGPRFDGRMVDASETYPDGRVLRVPYSPIPDNHESFFRTGSTIRNSVTLQGGNEEGGFLMSLDHANVEGVVPQDQFNRTNARLKGHWNFGKLKVGGNMSFYRSHANVVTDGGHQERPLFWYIYNTPLHLPITQYKNWRTGEFTRNEVSFYRFYENPYFIVDTQRAKTDINEFTFIGDAKYEFTDWLSATARVGYTRFNLEDKEEKGGLTYDFEIENDYATIATFPPSTRDEADNSTRVNSDVIISLDKPIGDNFNIAANVGHNLRIESSKEIVVAGNGLILPGFYNVSTRTGNLEGSETSSDYRKVGVYADATLGFKDFLFLSGSARNDWSSALNKDNRSYFYPGGGISFVPTSAFPGMQGTLRYLKATFNVAKTGNDPNPYATNRTFFAPDGSQGYGSFPYGSTAGLSLSSTEPSPDLKPEFTTSLEAGIEFGLFSGDRLSGSVAVYKTNTTDQLVPINTSLTSGARQIFTNLGEIENRGLEIDLNGTPIRAQDFSWDLGINYSFIESEVISLTEGVDEVVVGGPFVDNADYGAVIVAQVGAPYPLIKTTDYQRDDQGRVIVGEDGDPVEAGDLQVQGKTTPDYIVGLNTTLNFKNFSLYAVMDYRTGHVFYNTLVDALEFTGLTKHSATSNRQPFIFPNSVYADGNGGFVENTNRPTSGGGNNFWNDYNDTKSNYVTDATTLKLREVSLGYTFDERVTDKLGIQGLGVKLYGRNLLMLRPDENVYSDPEFNFNSGNAVGFGTQSQTAPTRQYGLSLTAKF
ncbi:MAG TPA: SusC/RagA family TonB-linked outer membrane protein [Pricia sp.]|nr:SusC/RagA family TonB-linked outer membrane protein [Pricia sp.]